MAKWWCDTHVDVKESTKFSQWAKDKHLRVASRELRVAWFEYRSDQCTPIQKTLVVVGDRWQGPNKEKYTPWLSFNTKLYIIYIYIYYIYIMEPPPITTTTSSTTSNHKKTSRSGNNSKNNKDHRNNNHDTTTGATTIAVDPIGRTSMI
jgi:hypothetical protein